MDTARELDRFRPIPFYFLNTADPAAYTQDAVDAAMRRMKELGFGGIVLFNKPPAGFDREAYLSEEWFAATGRFIRAARQFELQLWINDGFNYPPGDAGGRIEAADPTLKQLRLRPNDAGRLEVVEVPWGFPAFEEPESSAYFHRFVYEEYYRRFAAYFGDGITGFFSDADNRRFNARTQREMSERYYPWSRRFAELFYARFGYRIETSLKALFSGSDAAVASDYWQLCGDLYQAWFANNHAWCAAHNVLYTFHTSDTGPFAFENCRRSSVFTEGDPLALLGHSDCPGTDHELLVLDGGTHYDARYHVPEVALGGGPPPPHPLLDDTSRDVRAKYASSAAVLGGRERVMCEMFAATNWGATFNDLRRIAAWQIMQGVNFIVPHAVHHRFCGSVKHFAPPEFAHGTLRHGLREFNDLLAGRCRAAAAGKYLAQYAVVDPTKQVWRGRDPRPFFDFCDRMARRAEGYVIVPEDRRGGFPVTVDPLERFPELPEPLATFSGGDLAYMRRELDGTEYLLAANVWNPRPVSGTLVFRGRSVELELEPGEIAIIGGPFEDYRRPCRRAVVRRFTDDCPVEWEEPNSIPFEQTLVFRAPRGMALNLLIPAGHPGKVRFNGGELLPAGPDRVYDDEYRRYALESAEENAIELENPADFATPAMLRGDFDLELATRGDGAKRAYRQYALNLSAPDEARFTLSPRRKMLALSRGWEKQGQLFYSGAAVIRLGSAELRPGDQLELSGFTRTAELLIDGRVAGRTALSPYRFELPEGRHELALRLWNSMANALERYAAPSGLTEPPAIVRPE